MRFSTAIAVTGLSSAVLGAPAAGNTPPKNQPYSYVHAAECKAINNVITALQKVPTASAFCSSYLHIPTITSTVTKTATAVKPVTSSTYTGTTTISRLQTLTQTEAATVTSFTSTEIDTVTTTTFITAYVFPFLTKVSVSLT